MKSLLVEFHRFNNLMTGCLRKGDPYLVSAASCPVREIDMPLDHMDFMDLMLDLRYQTNASARKEALQSVGKAMSELLGTKFLKDLAVEESPIQLDLVVNAAELAALPFEAALGGGGEPILVADKIPVELTRRVRHDFAETSVRWPAKPRILFAWACPPGAGVDVPHKEHEEALLTALKPWLPDREVTGDETVPGNVMVTLKETSLEALEKTCREAADAKKPFSHIHILAHGYPIGRKHRQRFGVALHGEGGELNAVAPEEVAEALKPLSGFPVIVTMATCDSANLTNTLLPERSIAHELHVSGFPVVLASQLPLTVSGSNLLISHFYGALMAGKDVRDALHEARTALHDNSKTCGHDWASLVGYVRLPEGYADHLLDVRLESTLASLKTVQATSDQLVKSETSTLEQFDKVEQLLRGRIADLERFLDEIGESGKSGIREENLGLLGSASKRLAELYFQRGKRFQKDNRQQLMFEALKKSCDWYGQGYEYNLSHHWTGGQYLSLESVLDGKISEPGYWHAAVSAAKINGKKPKEYWAYGSLTELFLLAPVAGQGSQIELAEEALKELVVRVLKYADGDVFPLQSTQRQLRRYIDWWTTGNGFFPKTSDLAADAHRLESVLQEEWDNG